MIMFFSAVTLCRLIDRFQRFGEKYTLHLQEMETEDDSMIIRNVGTYETTRRHNPEEQHRQRKTLLTIVCVGPVIEVGATIPE
jgi:hypothetical protein